MQFSRGATSGSRWTLKCNFSWKNKTLKFKNLINKMKKVFFFPVFNPKLSDSLILLMKQFSIAFCTKTLKKIENKITY